MVIYKVQITYPNGNMEEIEEDFFSLDKAKEYAEHILGEVQYNAQFHESSFDEDGVEKVVDPYCLILARDAEKEEVVFDTRN